MNDRVRAYGLIVAVLACHTEVARLAGFSTINDSEVGTGIDRWSEKKNQEWGPIHSENAPRE